MVLFEQLGPGWVSVSVQMSEYGWSTAVPPIIHSVVSADFNLRARLFEIFRNKNIFQNIFRLFCSWEQNSWNGNPGIPE